MIQVSMAVVLLSEMNINGFLLCSGPLKGIPKIGLPANSFKAPIRSAPRAPVKKDGGIKMLEISDVQAFGRDAKRKKKNPEEKEEKVPETEATVTPDYAAGLTSTIPPSPAPFIASEPGKHRTQQPHAKMTESPAPPPILRQTQPIVIQTQHQPSMMQLPLQTSMSQHQPQAIPVQAPIIISQPQQPTQHVVMNPSQVNTDRKLILSKEQMAEAQDMFRHSNRVSRPEKALILGFMAGSRDNPCPNLGNVVTIKLNEEEGDVQQHDGQIVRCMIETHYQMNYVSGEGKRINKYVRIDPFRVN